MDFQYNQGDKNKNQLNYIPCILRLDRKAMVHKEKFFLDKHLVVVHNTSMDPLLSHYHRNILESDLSFYILH